jgi:hypothetical protein
MTHGNVRSSLLRGCARRQAPSRPHAQLVRFLGLAENELAEPTHEHDVRRERGKDGSAAYREVAIYWAERLPTELREQARSAAGSPTWPRAWRGNRRRSRERRAPTSRPRAR